MKELTSMESASMDVINLLSSLSYGTSQNVKEEGDNDIELF